MTANDRIRQELGFDLVKAARDAGATPKPAPQPPQTPEPKKDERCVTILDND